MELKKSIVKVGIVNVVSLASNLILGFLVPSVLSIENYSYLKTYTFYLSYVGLLHFGFVDGMYIKYGGTSIIDIDNEKLKCEHKIFLSLESAITLISLISSLILQNKVLLMVSLSILPVNILSFYRSFYQSVGEFSKYTKIIYIYTIIYFIGNLLLAYILRADNYIYYCFIIMVANIIVAANLEINFIKGKKDIKNIYFKEVWNNIKIGCFILLGNFSVLIFCAIDRWFVKIFYTVEDFAYYSFAISVINIVNVLINCISVTMYNYISRNFDEEKLVILKKYMLLIGCISTISYFLLSGIINIILKKYIPALNIISALFLSYPYMMIINTLYINIYKANKEEKKYFTVVVKMLIAACLYNIIALYFRTISAIAIATTCSYITWYIYSMKDFKYLKSNRKEILYLIIVSILFIICINVNNWIYAAVIYTVAIMMITMIMYKKEFVFLLHNLNYKL